MEREIPMVTPELTDREFALEDANIKAGIENFLRKYNENRLNDGDMSTQDPDYRIMKATIPALAEAIHAFLNETRKGQPQVKMLVKRIKDINPYELAYITVRFCFNNHFNTTSPDENLGRMVPKPLKILCDMLGQEIKDHVDYHRFLGSKKEVEMTDGTVKTVTGQAIIDFMRTNRWKSSSSKHVEAAIKNIRHKEGIEDSRWTARETHHVGNQLIRLYIESCGIFEPVQVLSSKGRAMYALSLTDEGAKLLGDSIDACKILHPRLSPMVCPPKPWTSPVKGGYLRNHVARLSQLLRRKPDRKTMGKLFKEHNAGKLNKLYAAMNALQETPWQINQPVLDVAEELVMKNQGGVAGLPDWRPVKDKEFQVKRWVTDEEYEAFRAENPEEAKDILSKLRVLHQDFHDRACERGATIEILRIAKTFREDVIWFPHNLDWRGRIYPNPIFFNPQGADLTRGLLMFARGKALGSRGARWLKIHGANCMADDGDINIDKQPLDFRVQWVEANEDKIQLVAENPFGSCFDWWTAADKPFQFLAFCFEYVRYLKEGESMVSVLPVQVDGTCNGIQHLAAIAKDEATGKLVGLVPTDKPCDVYSEVAKVSESIIQERMVEGDEIAKAWHGKVTRKLVKRNAMTKTYGATHRGFRDQLDAALHKLGSDYLTIPRYIAANYLAEVNSKAIDRLMPAISEVMNYLQKVARMVTKATNQPIVWTSPIGLPVRQVRWHKKMVRIKTVWGDSTIKFVDHKKKDKLHVVKMGHGIAPNFVHSYDASHLFFTTLKAVELGIQDFSMIHDSYGCHAADMDDMVACLTDAFIDIYADNNILENFRDEVIENLPEKVREEVLAIPMPSPVGEPLDIRGVMDSDYFFA